MDSTIEVTQRLDRLSIAANAPFLSGPAFRQSSTAVRASEQGINQPSSSSEAVTSRMTALQSPALPPSQSQTATAAGITRPDSHNDVTMSDDIITATRNLSLQSSPLQNRRALEAHRRQHAEWSRQCNQRRHGTVPINFRIMQASHAARASQARPRPRPSSQASQASQEASRFLRHCAHIEARQNIRSRHRSQRASNTRVQSNSEATGMTRDEYHRNLFMGQQRNRRQLMVLSAIAARAEN